MPDYISKYTGDEIDEAIGKSKNITKDATQINKTLQYVDDTEANLKSLNDNELIAKRADGTLISTGIINESNKIFFPKDGRFPSGSIDVGPAATLSENGGWLQYMSNTLNKDYLLLDYFVDITGSTKPVYWQRSPQETNVIINPYNVDTLTDLQTITHIPTSNSQVNAIYMDFVNPVSNFLVEIVSLVTNKPIKYIPDEASWRSNSGGIDLTTGINNILQGSTSTPFSALTTYQLKFNFKSSNPINVKGNSTGNIPWLKVDRQIITAKNVLVDGDGGGSSDTAEQIRDKLETLTNDERLRAVAIRNLPVETGDTVRDKLAGLVGDNRLDASAIKNLPGGSGGSETGDTIRTKLEALVGDNRLSANALKDMPSGTAETAESIRDKLETLTGDNKLAATAIKNISDVINRIDGGSANAVFTDTMNGGAA